MENCDTAKIQIKGQITCMASMIPLLKGEVVGRLKKAVIDSMQRGPGRLEDDLETFDLNRARL